MLPTLIILLCMLVLWQIEDLGESFKLLKHAPQRWLSLSGTFERVIVLWHYFRVLYSEDGKTFPLDDITEDILELYSLMVPCATIMRESQHGSEPMAGKMHSLVALLMVSTLDPDKPLKVRRGVISKRVRGS